MELLNDAAVWFAKDVLGVPAYLVGLLTLIALVASRRSARDVMGGTLKATLGFVILGIGSQAVVSGLDPLGKLMTASFGVRGVVPLNESITAIASSIPAVAETVAFAMPLGVMLSLVIARLTPLRYVFLTGHHLLFMATVLVLVLEDAGTTDALQIAVAAMGLATMAVVMPAFSMPWMRKVTAGEAVAMGHFGTLGYIAAGIAGQLVGRGSRSTEEMHLPGLRVLGNPIVGPAIALIAVYAFLALLLLARLGEAAAIDAVSIGAGSGGGGMRGWMTAMGNNALVFAGGVAVVLLAVRTILSEMVPAFAGLAERILPGARPALDGPVAFPYAPNAVLIGFLASVAGGVLGFQILWATNWLSPALGVTLVLPGLIPHFFSGGTAGVFGNATGGRRGAIAGGLVNGLLITILAALLVPLIGRVGGVSTTFGDADLQWFGFVVGNLGSLGGLAGGLGAATACGVLLAVASWWQIRYVNAGWVPGGGSGRDAPREPETLSSEGPA